MIHGGEWEKDNITIDFSVNLNPSGVPDEVVRMLSNTEPEKYLMRYPDRECSELRMLMADKYGVDKDNIICGNGASELISAVAKALSLLGVTNVLLPVPSFIGYERSLNACFSSGSKGMKVSYYLPERQDGFVINDHFINALEVFAGGCDVNYDKALILCNPNNPTGRLIDKKYLDSIVRICRVKRIRLVMDECFLGFCDDGNDRSLKALTNDDPGICIIDAFTKLYAVPGVRLGFMISGDKPLNDLVRDILPEWNVSLLANAVGKTILTEVPDKYLTATKEIIRKEKAYLCDALGKAGFTVYPGEACFILFRVPDGKREDDRFENLQERLAGSGILIRSCGNFNGLDGYDYRIAVRSHEDNVYLINAIKNLI